MGKMRVAVLMSLGGLVLTAAGGFLTNPASAVEAVNSTPTGTEPQSPDANQASFWEAFTEVADQCVKTDGNPTPLVLPPLPEGTSYSLLVIKAGSGADANAYWLDPVPGAYSHPAGHATSHYVICTTATPPSSTTSTTSTTSSTTSTTEPESDTPPTSSTSTTSVVPNQTDSPGGTTTTVAPGQPTPASTPTSPSTSVLAAVQVNTTTTAPGTSPTGGGTPSAGLAATGWPGSPLVAVGLVLLSGGAILFVLTRRTS